MKNRFITPVGAVARGALAGFAASALQSYFFKVTAGITPETPRGKDVFDPPEPEQASELPTQTVARRFVEQFMRRGPLSDKAKAHSASVVHFLFGTAWGGVYGLVRESLPGASRSGPGRALAEAGVFGTAVWLASDNLILPAFRVSGWPQKYPLRNHLYALAAHLVYGLGVYGTYRASTRITDVRSMDPGQAELPIADFDSGEPSLLRAS